MTAAFLPWQALEWQQLWQRKQAQKLPHALLFIGMEGVGKRHFASQFAKAVLCGGDSATPDCSCRSCGFIQAGSHPDLLMLEPIDNGKVIKIEQIRDATVFVNQSPLFGGYRVIIINPANAMNTYSANALLKTLEEPSSNTLIMLLSHQSLRLPATILSRCQKIHFPKPDSKLALEWLGGPENELPLKLAHGAPLQAKEYLTNGMMDLRKDLYQELLKMSQGKTDPLQSAAKWADKQHESKLDMLFKLLFFWIHDLMQCMLIPAPTNWINADYKDHFMQLKSKLNIENLMAFDNQVQETYGRVISSINVNRELTLEDVFIRWTKLCI